MRCRIRSLSTVLSSITIISIFQNEGAARLAGGLRRSRAGRHGRGGTPPELIYRSVAAPARPVRQPAPQIIHNTIHQTVVHLHQTTQQRVFNQFTAAGTEAAELIVRQTPTLPAPEGGIDSSRPTLMAGRLLRILSTGSARKVLQPYFDRIVRDVLEQEREIWQSRPSQAPPAAAYGLSGAEFWALVRSVTEAVNRQNRLNGLRRGGDG